MFSPEIAKSVQQAGSGLTPEAVNQIRLNVRPLEQLPLSRQRYALAARIAHRFTASTFRAEERVYLDSWGLKASTTDLRYLLDLSKAVLKGMGVRPGAQRPVEHAGQEVRIAQRAINEKQIGHVSAQEVLRRKTFNVISRAVSTGPPRAAHSHLAERWQSG